MGGFGAQISRYGSNSNGVSSALCGATEEVDTNTSHENNEGQGENIWLLNMELSPFENGVTIHRRSLEEELVVGEGMREERTEMESGFSLEKKACSLRR